jgi:hypothetical protein
VWNAAGKQLGQGSLPYLEAGIEGFAETIQAAAAKISFTRRSYRFFVSATGPGDGFE